MTARRILVTGSRNATREHREKITRHLTKAWQKLGCGPDVILVNGKCPTGVDSIARDIWLNMGLPVEDHPADWDKYGRPAGPIRNQEMVDLGADICLGFPVEGIKNIGTEGCLLMAFLAGIKVKRVWLR